VPVDAEHGKGAGSAFSRFGKGRHRAGLNYGDCFSYALAISTGEPLLFKADGFRAYRRRCRGSGLTRSSIGRLDGGSVCRRSMESPTL
jgi:hypothetical protein